MAIYYINGALLILNLAPLYQRSRYLFSSSLEIQNSELPYLQDSFKLTVDKFMMKRMETLKNLVNKKNLKMTFEQEFVSKENTALLTKIRAMNPNTIDWSNIPDYLYKTNFLDLGKGHLI